MANTFNTTPASSPTPSQPPSSRQQLVDYAMRKLGAPVIEINVDEDQIEDRLDDALLLFANYHYDGVEMQYLKHQVTQADIDRGWIPAADPIISVVRAFVFDEAGLNNLFDYPWRFSLSRLGEFAGRGGGAPFADLTTLDITKRWLSLAQQMLTPEKSIRFNRVTNKIYVDMDWEEEIRPDLWLMFQVYVVVDPELYVEIYNDVWVKEYFTALVKRQWGQNLSKFDGIQMPGGVTFNGQQIFDQAQEEITRLKEELDLKWSLPPDFMMG